MLSVAAQLTGDTEVLRLLEWGAEHLPLTTARGLRRGAVILEDGLRQNLSGGVLQRRTSTLVRSVGTQESDLGLVQRIGASTFYLAVHEGEVENATVDGDHVVIEAKSARGMVFQIHTGNRISYSKTGKLRRGAAITQWVRVPRVRIPIRRPVGVTYDELGEDAMQEAYETVKAAMDGGGE